VSAVDTSRAARAAGRGEWPTRLLSGIALAIVAVAAVWYPKAMAALLAVLCLFAAREWHRMVRTIPTPQSLAHWQTIVTAAENGADTFVAGSSVFRGEPAERIAGLRAAVAAHTH